MSHAYGGWDSNIIKFMDQKDLYHYEDEEGGNLLFPESSMNQSSNTTKKKKLILNLYLNDYEQLYSINKEK